MNYRQLFKIKFSSVGFTLLEIVLVTSLVLVIGLLTTSFGRNIFLQNYIWSQTLIAESEAKLAIRRLVAELRTAQPANTGTYLIEQANRNSLIFYSDVNNDGKRERLRYFLDNGSLKRGWTPPTGQPYIYATTNEKISIVARNLVNPSNLIFSYYSRDYDGTASSSPLMEPIDIKDIRLIKIELYLDANSKRSPEPIHLFNQVMIRNLKDNF